MKNRILVVCSVVWLGWFHGAFASLEFGELDKKYEVAKAKLNEPLEALRESFREHLVGLEKELAATGGSVAAKKVAEAAAAGDPDPDQLSTVPKLRKAQTLFLSSKEGILEEIKPGADSLRATYLAHLKRMLEGLSSVDDQEMAFAVAEKIAALEKEVADAEAVGRVTNLSGRFHLCVDDSATVYINGERIHWAGLGCSKSDVVELNEGDDIFFSARNGGGGAKCFKALFLSEDGEHVINFKSGNLKVIEDGTKARTFTAAEIGAITLRPRVMPGSGSGIKATFALAEDSDWLWDEGGHTMMVTIFEAGMVRAVSGPATVIVPKSPPADPVRPEP